MKKKYFIGSVIIIAIVFLSLFIIYLLPIKDKFKIVLFFIVLIAALFPTVKLEKEMKKFTKEEERKQHIESKKKFISLLESKLNDNIIFVVMYDLITEQNVEINSLMKEKNLEFNFDFMEEQNYYEIFIESKNNKKFDYLSIAYEDDERYFYSTFTDEEQIDINELLYDQVIDTIISNLKGTSEN